MHILTWYIEYHPKFNSVGFHQTQINGFYRKIPKISPGLIAVKDPFWGAYIRRGLSTYGNLLFKIDWASLIVRSKFTVFALFYFAFEGNFPSTSPRRAYIFWGRKRFNGGFFALPVWGAYFRNFTVWSPMSRWHLTFANLKTNASRNCFWDCYWGLASQLLANFFVAPSNNPRSLCKSQLVPVFSFLKWWIHVKVKLCFSLQSADEMLVHLQSFSSNSSYYTIPESTKNGVPLFYLPPNSNNPVSMSALKASMIKQSTFRDVTTGFLAKWPLRN